MPLPEPPAPKFEDVSLAVGKLEKKDKLQLLQELSLQVKLTGRDWQSAARSLLPEDLRRKFLRYPWSLEDRRNLGLLIKVPICVQDPAFAQGSPEQRFDEIEVGWEPGLLDGPTSARLTVVDYEHDIDFFRDQVKWDEQQGCFVDQEKQPIVPKLNDDHFHQVNVWAIVQRVLDFYEDLTVLGRPVPWAFRGNRLTILPHATKDKTTTCYDRESKSLQFAYFNDPNGPVFTCLSHDIVAHETGHAILDGIRPYFHKGYTLQSQAFDEFTADLTAILSALRNNDVRHIFVNYLEKGEPEANFIADIAEEFGRAVTDRKYLRTALNEFTMSDVSRWAKDPSADAAHDASQVLAGLIFDIFLRLLQSYRWERDPQEKPYPAAWNATQRITRLALQPLDYLPPLEVTFSDYVEALLVRDELLNPEDPYKYRDMIRELAAKRQIGLPPAGQQPVRPNNLANPYVDGLLASRTSAYEYVHANRQALRIPARRDIIVDVCAAEKVGRAFHRLPRDIIVQYFWEEEVPLQGDKFGPLKDQDVPLLCGGTIVFDENSNFLYWVTKPGTEFLEEQKDISRRMGTRLQQELEEDQQAGELRRQELLDYAARLAAEQQGPGEVDAGKLLSRFPSLNSATF
jgi:hypothetical protein